jgi:hypothetical protein
MNNIENELVYLDGLNYKGFVTDTGSVNVYAVTLDPAITAYTAGLQISFKVANTNTGTSTLNVNGLGAKAITKYDLSYLTAGDIVVGQIVTVMYDGSAFQLLSLKQMGFYKQIFTSSGTFTAPYPGTYKVTVTGGGGSGGNYGIETNGEGGGGGGGGGGTAIKWVNLSLNQAVTVTVGSGGAACASTYNATSNGNAGGTSSFGSYCSATGGYGGTMSGGGGGTGSNGEMNLSGESTMIPPSNTSTNGPVSIIGGSSYWGGGSSYGAGSNGVPTGASQAGKPGIVLVEWVG